MNHSLNLKKKMSSGFQNLHQLLLTIEWQSYRACQRQLIKNISNILEYDGCHTQITFLANRSSKPFAFK